MNKRILLILILISYFCVSNYSQNYTFIKMDFNGVLSEVATYYRTNQLYVYRNKPFYKFNRKYYDLYTIEVDKAKTKSRFKRLGDDINTRYNEGPVTFNEDDKLVYVTRNRFSKQEMKENQLPENPLMIDIYEERNGEFIFKEKFPYNDTFYSVAHACYSEITKRLYFTSDKKGGYGGTDIYYCDINKDGSYGKPINLGKKVNTKKEEKFTVVKDGVLFFSSDGHHVRKDLDIYYITELGLNNGEKPKHLKEPFNSRWDDFGIALINGYSGYLSSNRDHEQEYNHDVYYFDIGQPIMKKDEFNLLLIIEEEKRNKLILENFRVVDLETNESLSTTIAEDGIIVEKLIEDRNYEVRFDDTLGIENAIIGPYTKNNIADVFIKDTLYLKDVILALVDTNAGNDTLNTVLTDSNILANVDSNLAQQVDSNTQQLIDTTSFTSNSGTDSNELVSIIRPSDIYFDFDKVTLRDDAKKELDMVVRFFRVNGQVKLKIWAHADNRGEEQYNLILSKNRAKTVYDYLVDKGMNEKQIIEYKGFGESRPLFKCDENTFCSPKQHEKNRRVEFVLLKK